MRLKRNVILGIIVSILLVVVYRCTIPLPFKPYSIFCNTKEEIIAAERSVWIYKPICDSLVIKDSVRDLHFHIKHIYAYDPKRFEKAYLWLFLPWVKLSNTGNVKYFTICFDYMNLEDKWDFRNCIVLNIRDSAMTEKWDRWTYDGVWDDSIAGKSYYETKEMSPLPDTLYLTIWGQKDLFLPYSVYKNLPSSEQSKMFSSKYENGQVKIGQIAIIKVDSVICKKKKKPEEIKLFIRKVRHL